MKRRPSHASQQVGSAATRVGVAAVLGVLAAQSAGPARAQTALPPVAGLASPCVDFPAESPQACSDRPLNANPRSPLQVAPGAARTTAHSVLPAASEGVPYDAKLVTGGFGAYTGHVVGRLPEGLRIGADGHLFGVPTQRGVFPFLLIIRDSSSPARELTEAFTIEVTPPPATARRPS